MIFLRKVKGLLTVFAAAAAFICAGTAVNAEIFDYDYDMSKSRWTYGGGYSFITYTRLDGERKDRHQFDPRWITPDTQIVMEYETEGEYEGCPASLVLQSWPGELVESTEERSISCEPTEFSSTTAIYNYEDLVRQWGDDNFAILYSLSVADKGENSLFVSSLTITNVDVPPEEISDLKGGFLLKNGTEIDVNEYTVTEPTTTVQTEITTPESSEITSAEEETIETEPVTSSETWAEKEEAKEEKSSPNIIRIIIIAIVIVIIMTAVIIFVLGLKKKNYWH